MFIIDHTISRPMIQRPRGTRDFGPEEMEIRRFFEDMMRQEAVLHGFHEVSTPIFEHTELFTLKSGPGVVEEIYTFQDKGGREICLRPELTASVVRFFLNDMTNLPRPLKMFYFGQCFRYERPQAGRYREFFQFGSEIIGNPTPETDAEVIGLAGAIVERSGLRDYRIRIGHIGILRELLSRARVEGDKALPILQKLDKKMYDEVRPMMMSAGMTDEDIRTVFDLTQVVGDVSVLEGMTGEAIQYLMEVFGVLGNYGIDKALVDLGVVRGLDYYTGIVFEVEAPCLGAEKQVCGGGSSSLSEILGGERVFSTGFAIGFDRTMLALEKEGLDVGDDGIDAFVIPVKEAQMPKAFEIVSTLRRAGLRADVDLMRRSIGKNLKYADSSGARRAVIVGENELEQGSVTVRDMDSGEQTLVRIEELINFLDRPNSS